jgi:hypothetical protein
MGGDSQPALWRHPRVRRALRAAALTVTLGGAALAAAWYLQARAHARAQALAEALAARTGGVDARALDDSMSESLDSYRRLRERGFVGAPDAVGLLEAVTAAAERLGLAAPAYELAPVPARAGDERDNAAGGLRQFDLKLTLTGVHEEEVLALIEALQETARGLVLPRQCALVRRTGATGLAAECRLRWSVFVAEAVNLSAARADLAPPVLTVPLCTGPLLGATSARSRRNLHSLAAREGGSP